jgi:hypothetical protein
MSISAAEGVEDGNGGGHSKGKNTSAAPDSKKMSTLEKECFDICKEKLQMSLQEERNLFGMLFMLHQTCIIICKEKLQMPLQGERNFLMVVFMLHQYTPCVANPPAKKGMRKDKSTAATVTRDG